MSRLIEPAEEHVSPSAYQDVYDAKRIYIENMTRYSALVAGRAIAGPISFTFVPYFLGKAFYIFGDAHQTSRECTGVAGVKGSTPIDVFLDGLFRHHSLPPGRGYVDFYFEHFLTEEDRPSTLSVDHWEKIDIPIYRVMKKFEKCLKTQKEGREGNCGGWPKTRVHNTDVRYAPDIIVTHEATLSAAIAKMTGGKLMMTDLFKKKRAFLLTKNDIIAEIENYLQPEVVEYTPSRYVVTHKNRIASWTGRDDATFSKKITKQLGKSYLKKEIVEYTLDLINRLADKYDALVSQLIVPAYINSATVNGRRLTPIEVPLTVRDFVQRLFELTSEKEEGKERVVEIDADLRVFLERAFVVINRLMNNISSSMMDVYTLARIFKSTTAAANGREVWIYEGNYHAVNLIKFMEFIAGRNADTFALKSRIGEYKVQCVVAPHVYIGQNIFPVVWQQQQQQQPDFIDPIGGGETSRRQRHIIREYEWNPARQQQHQQQSAYPTSTTDSRMRNYDSETDTENMTFRNRDKVKMKYALASKTTPPKANPFFSRKVDDDIFDYVIPSPPKSSSFRRVIHMIP